MYTILVVEDENILREAVTDYFINEGYQVLEASNGIEALEVLNEHHTDLIILDIMMPEMDGWSVCRRIRRTSDVPIILLTARSDEEDTLFGFELGADDYVTKPFNPSVLIARAKTLLKRSGGMRQTLEGDTICLAGIYVTPSSRSVSVDDHPIDLTHTEFEILYMLMEQSGTVVTRDALIVRIWGYDYEGEERTINTHIRNLRSKLGDKAKHIATIVRNGYKFVVEV